MVVLSVQYNGLPGNGDKIAELMTSAVSLVLANEPGCKIYQLSRSKTNSDNFLLYEVYVDEAAFAAHRETTYFKSIVQEQVWPLLEKRERSDYDHVAG